MELINGGIAGAGATIFTNPMDVIKVRLQLQGELRARGEHVQMYRGVMQGMYIVAKNEGVMALQKGLLAAMFFGFSMNSVRLGLFRLFEKNGWTKNKEGDTVIVKAIVCSFISGFLSGITATPASVVKTRMQSAAHHKIAVSHQHKYSGNFDAVKSIYRASGIKGFFVGMSGSCYRLAVGSIAQLTMFAKVKEALYAKGICQNSPVLLAFVASMFSGVVMSLATCPLDVASTRLYNQGTGSKRLYNGLWDCLSKTFKTEGLHGLYKGVGPLYLRLGPHTTISLVIWDRMNSWIR